MGSMMVINNKYEIGQHVYLVSDSEQQKRIITSFRVYKAGEIVYTVACGILQSEHYDFELSSDKDVLISTT